MNDLDTPGRRRKSASGATLRDGQAQGLASAGPITMGKGRHAEQMVQVVYNTQHKMPWHWPVPAYLVTKAIGSGIAMWIALAYLLDLFRLDSGDTATALFVALGFTAVTTALLVFDLERPERFLRILTRPQWRSWLVRGAYLLVGFSIVAGVWWALEAFGLAGSGGAGETTARTILALITVPLALGAAVYTAFLFGQAEGRDLWQSSLLPAHLIIQAFMAGSAALLILGAIVGLPADAIAATRTLFAAAIVVDLIVTFFGEFGMPHASESAAQAAHDIKSGRYRQHFWLGSVVLGHAGPLVLLLVGAVAADVAASTAVIVGLYLYEYAFVMAPQHVPNS